MSDERLLHELRVTNMHDILSDRNFSLACAKVRCLNSRDVFNFIVISRHLSNNAFNLQKVADSPMILTLARPAPHRDHVSRDPPMVICRAKNPRSYCAPDYLCVP